SPFPSPHGWLPPPLHCNGNAPLPLRAKLEVPGFGSMLEPRYIVRARPLDQWAFTHSFNGGCFQDNILVVAAIEHRFPLSMELGALADGLGCFPFEHEAYPPHSDC